MRNVWLKYTAIRLGMFLAITIGLALLGMVWVAAALIGAMLSFAFSIVFLSKLRDQMSKELYEKRANKPKKDDSSAEDF
ncbi:MAG: hypothetical protein RIQ88_707 [Actinomycetota bacterium]|jgi:uncharacterized membrane protein YkgB